MAEIVALADLEGMDDLYDLSADPYEMRNLSRPESQQPLKGVWPVSKQ